MLRFEMRILFRKRGAFFLLLFLLAGKWFLLLQEAPVINTAMETDKQAYCSLMKEYQGMVTEEKESAILSLYEEKNQAQEKYTALVEKYVDKKISGDTYSREVLKLREYLDQADVIDILYEEYQYSEEYPKERFLLYNNGWRAWLATSRLDITLLLCAVFLVLLLYSADFSGVSLMLQASRSGSSLLTVTRYLCALILIFFFSVVSALEEFLFFLLRYGLPCPNAPLQSLVDFQNSPYQLTLLQTAAGQWILKLIGTVFLASCTALLVQVTRNVLWPALSSILLILIPYALWGRSSILYRYTYEGLLLAVGYFRGHCEWNIDDEKGVVITTGFAGVEPLHALILVVAVLLGTGFIVCGMIYFYQYNGKLLKRLRRKYCLTVFGSFVLLALGTGALLLSCEKREEKYTAEYSSMNRSYCDREFLYFPEEDLMQMVSLKEEESQSWLKDIFADSEKIIARYVDDQYLYYMTNDKTITGRVDVYAIDKQTFHQRHIYSQVSGMRSTLTDKSFLDCIERQTTDNTDGEALIEEAISDFWVDGNWLYLVDETKIVRVHLQSGVRETLVEGKRYGNSILYCKGVISYVNLKNEWINVSLRTGKTEKMTDAAVRYLYLLEGNYYYRDMSGTLWEYQREGKDREVGRKLSDTTNVSLWNGTIYYCNTKGRIMGCQTDTYKTTVLAKDRYYYSAVAYACGWIYGYCIGQEDFEYVRLLPVYQGKNPVQLAEKEQ